MSFRKKKKVKNPDEDGVRVIGLKSVCHSLSDLGKTISGHVWALILQYVVATPTGSRPDLVWTQSDLAFQCLIGNLFVLLGLPVSYWEPFCPFGASRGASEWEPFVFLGLPLLSWGHFMGSRPFTYSCGAATTSRSKLTSRTMSDRFLVYFGAW